MSPILLYVETESFVAATVALKQVAQICADTPTGQRMVDALADFNRALAISRAFEARDVPSRRSHLADDLHDIAIISDERRNS